MAEVAETHFSPRDSAAERTCGRISRPASSVPLERFQRRDAGEGHFGDHDPMSETETAFIFSGRRENRNFRVTLTALGAALVASSCWGARDSHAMTLTGPFYSHRPRLHLRCESSCSLALLGPALVLVGALALTGAAAARQITGN